MRADGSLELLFVADFDRVTCSAYNQGAMFSLWKILPECDQQPASCLLRKVPSAILTLSVLCLVKILEDSDLLWIISERVDIP